MLRVVLHGGAGCFLSLCLLEVQGIGHVGFGAYVFAVDHCG